MKSIICSFLLLFIGLSLQAQGTYYKNIEALLKDEGQTIKEVKKARLVRFTLEKKECFAYNIKAELANGETLKSIWDVNQLAFYKKDGQLYCLKRTQVGLKVRDKKVTPIYQDDFFELQTIGNFFYFKLVQTHPFINDFKKTAQFKIKAFESEHYNSMLFMGASKMTWGLVQKEKMIGSLENIADVSNVGRGLYLRCLNYLEQKAEKEGLAIDEVSFSLKEFEDILFKFERGEI